MKTEHDIRNKNSVESVYAAKYIRCETAKIILPVEATRFTQTENSHS